MTDEPLNTFEPDLVTRLIDRPDGCLPTLTVSISCGGLAVRSMTQSRVSGTCLRTPPSLTTLIELATSARPSSGVIARLVGGPTIVLVSGRLTSVRGASVGLLYSAGRVSAPELATLLTGQFTGASEPPRAVAFLRGLLRAAREAAWQQPELLQALDAMLAGWDEATFIDVLPELRMAFADLTPRETDRVGEAVASLHGSAHLGNLVNYDVGEAQLKANLTLSQTLLAVLQADGLRGWSRS